MHRVAIGARKIDQNIRLDRLEPFQDDIGRNLPNVYILLGMDRDVRGICLRIAGYIDTGLHLLVLLTQDVQTRLDKLAVVCLIKNQNVARVFQRTELMLAAGSPRS